MWLCMTNFRSLCLFTWQLHDLKVGSEAQIWQICDLELYSHFQSSKSQKSFKLHLWNFQMLWRCYTCVHTSNFRPLPPFSCQLSQDLKVNFPLPPKNFFFFFYKSYFFLKRVLGCQLWDPMIDKKKEVVVQNLRYAHRYSTFTASENFINVT